MAGYAVTSTKLDDYREKAEEMLGAKKTQQLNQEVAQRAVDRNPVGNHEVIILPGGNELMYDDWSGRYFRGSLPIVERAVAELDTLIAQNGVAKLNDFYDFVGLPTIPIGLTFGWQAADGIVTIGSNGTKTPDGQAAMAYWFHQAPKQDAGR